MSYVHLLFYMLVHVALSIQSSTLAIPAAGSSQCRLAAKFTGVVPLLFGRTHTSTARSMKRVVLHQVFQIPLLLRVSQRQSVTAIFRRDLLHGYPIPQRGQYPVPAADDLDLVQRGRVDQGPDDLPYDIKGPRNVDQKDAAAPLGIVLRREAHGLLDELDHVAGKVPELDPRQIQHVDGLRLRPVLRSLHDRPAELGDEGVVPEEAGQVHPALSQRLEIDLGRNFVVHRLAHMSPAVVEVRIVLLDGGKLRMRFGQERIDAVGLAPRLGFAVPLPGLGFVAFCGPKESIPNGRVVVGIVRGMRCTSASNSEQTIIMESRYAHALCHVKRRHIRPRRGTSDA